MSWRELLGNLLKKRNRLDEAMYYGSGSPYTSNNLPPALFWYDLESCKLDYSATATNWYDPVFSRDTRSTGNWVKGKVYSRGVNNYIRIKTKGTVLEDKANRGKWRASLDNLADQITSEKRWGHPIFDIIDDYNISIFSHPTS